MAIQLTTEQRTVAVRHIAAAFSLAATLRRTTNAEIAAIGETFAQMGYGMLTLIASLYGDFEVGTVRAAVKALLDVPIETFRPVAFDALVGGSIPPEDLAKLSFMGFEGDPRALWGIE